MRDDPMHVAPRHLLDMVSDPELVVLHRLDGSEVARFTAWGATWEEILHAAEEDAKESDED